MCDLSEPRQRLALLDRDGVIVENVKRSIKRVRDFRLIPKAVEAIVRLNAEGYRVVVCTNQPEVCRGAMSEGQLDEIHSELQQILAAQGAMIEEFICCTSAKKNPRLKPAGGMLTDALHRYQAQASVTPFIGDQIDDLKAAFHAGCLGVLVRTGLGEKALRFKPPEYLLPLRVADDLLDAVEIVLRTGRPPSSPALPVLGARH